MTRKRSLKAPFSIMLILNCVLAFQAFHIEIQLVAGQVDFIVPTYFVAACVHLDLIEKPRNVRKSPESLPFVKQRSDVVASPLAAFKQNSKSKIR